VIDTSLGSYKIVAKLGEGGMGEVYRARDSKLDRDVALKILPESFASDPDRLMRFEREAKTLASLNHPNIAAIYGLEGDTPQAGGGEGRPLALVMELVEGEDLSARIARGPMPIDDVLAIARQIADALEAAHEQGIVHRDLKPANVKVRPDGTVKVLDFGLAKAMDPVGTSGADAMNSPTLTARATQMGMILGTAAYMSPEQARGRAADRRADIWAFGVVVYEISKAKTSRSRWPASSRKTSTGTHCPPTCLPRCVGCCAGVSKRTRASGSAPSATRGSSSMSRIPRPSVRHRPHRRSGRRSSRGCGRHSPAPR